MALSTSQQIAGSKFYEPEKAQLHGTDGNFFQVIFAEKPNGAHETALGDYVKDVYGGPIRVREGILLGGGKIFSWK